MNELLALITAFKANPIGMGQTLVLLQPGNWVGLVKWAAGYGFTIALTDIQAYCNANPAILAKISQQPLLAAWNATTLASAITAAA